jgi:hypothetical protein
VSPDTATLKAARGGTNGAGAPVLPTGPFRPRAGVLAARELDEMALYDPGRERYLTINAVATRIWELLSDRKLPAQIVEVLCAEYGAPPERVTADVSAQIATWLRDHLIEPGMTGSPGEPHPAAPAYSIGSATADIHLPSVPRCVATIGWIKWLLSTRGFGGTVKRIRSRVEHIPPLPVEFEVIRTLEYVVAMAGAFYPGRAKCLEQSLALYYLARRRGMGVRYCQGVRLFPFVAHAWVEYQGKVVNDLPEHVKLFARFPDQLP